ncbi:Eco57I restriction-modification methylase domain-containing protein [Phocaeicola plebeius]|uniref:Eco57I restriction-modification methylase domain-containing protein n=1 Tax=Phocaeicola plebeius TaxID=310297 RepID=UPI0026EFBD8A|nr:Eco57I restriction-modification methylase domain-containing protein [Phocaeicola plebeius]
MADTNLKIDTTLLEGLIVGRVEPHIYAFSTETVPNYLKVGDTTRGVRVRLDEWRKIFPNLVQQYEHSAQIDDETIFRDFAVHTFLEQEKGRTRLLPDTFTHLPYYSKEFFKEATTVDLEEAISDIYQSAREKNGKYQFYSPDRLPQTFTYERTDSYSPRANQQQVIDNFRNAIAAGRTNLLLYAVMRFGKSFTAMCCAKEMDAKIVVVVSAKADVKQEWKKTVESHVYFSDYKFLDSTSLNRNETIVSDTLAAGDKVALFLTLQDLQGEEIKAKHKEVFEHQIDLLIVDETHFGARGASYGKVLQQYNLSKSQIEKELQNVDGFETLDQVDEVVKTLDTKIRIHLSGTPYRILMSDEFKKEDIIAFVQFTDIIDAQKQWDDKHLKEDDCNEWDNPYYGFPQMIRFAFNPNASSVTKMEELRKNGITYAFSELFRPHSMTPKRDGSHRQFLHEPEILDLLEVIDGTKEDENLLGFLDYDKIKEGKMCRHIVVVLPFRASCDAMAALIQCKKERFKNLRDYDVINIAGFDEERKYATTDIVKGKIKDCEEKGRKTLTLTVNRMLTGTTVPQWDTMLYLKGTASPQEYDQAIFRLQNQYVTTFKDESGRIIKYNMKPQTLLVDFDPNRMFRLQELKSQFYNVNTEVQGNVGLRERIAKELAISPIIVLNKHKLQEATPTNITDAVREYSRNRSVLDEASEIPVDSILLEDAEILHVLRETVPIDAKNGLQIKPTEGDGDDLDTPDTSNTPEGTGNRDAESTDQSNQQPDRSNPAEEDDKLDKRLAAYYARILFFAFLTDSTVKSLEEVITAIPQTSDNRRIANHLGLDRKVLEVIQKKSNPFILHDLDYKIENTNNLICDAALRPIERVEIAMRRFGRLSESEIVTPTKVADEMVAILPFEELNEKMDVKFLDIASKEGEFSVALYRRFGEKVKPGLYAIATSPLAYEFTRKVYTLLGMPVENIYANFTSYDLIGKNNNEIIKQLTDMKFDVVIGNPPYQESDGGAGASAKPIYNQFVNVSKEVGSTYLCIIMPSRWMAGGKGLDEFRNAMLNDKHIVELHDFMHPEDVFPNTNNRGGVCYFMRNANYDNTEHKVKVVTHYENYSQSTQRSLQTDDWDIFIRENQAFGILDKVVKNVPDFVPLSSYVSSRKPFGIESNIIRTSAYHATKDDLDNPVLCYGKGERVGYVEYAIISAHSHWVNKWKVFTPRANNVGTELNDDNLNSFIGAPNTICTEAYIVIGGDMNLRCKECGRILKYLKTKFVRYLHSLAKASHDATSKTYRFIPMQDFTKESDIDWGKSISEIDAQLYAKYGLTAEEIDFIESKIKPME